MLLKRLLNKKSADTLLCARLLFYRIGLNVKKLSAATASAAIVTATTAIICADTISAAATAADQNDDENEPDAGIVFKAHGKRSPHFVDSEPSYAFGQQMAAWP